MSSNFNPQNLRLSNDLIRLEPITHNDFDRLYVVASDPAIWEVHPSPDRYKKEVFRGFFDGALSSGTAFLVFDQVTGELIGSSRYYNIEPVKSSVAVGYTFLAKKFWGGLYNRSLKTLMLDHAFSVVNEVLFHIGAKNCRSQQAILKIGAIKIGEVGFESGGIMQPHFEYRITKDDWASRLRDAQSKSRS